MSQIPEQSRLLVRLRSRFRCERCGVPAPGGEWHHRRSRRVLDAHTHCACNGVYLCGTCHRWAHQHPVGARKDGWILSAFAADPGQVPVLTWLGPRLHNCNGGFEFQV